MIFYQPTQYIPTRRANRIQNPPRKYIKKGGEYGTHTFLRDNINIADIEGARSRRLFKGKN